MAAINYASIIHLLISYWKDEPMDTRVYKSCWQLARKIELKLSGDDFAGLKARPDDYREFLDQTVESLVKADVVARKLVQGLMDLSKKQEQSDHINQQLNVSGDGNQINLAGRDVIAGSHAKQPESIWGKDSMPGSPVGREERRSTCPTFQICLCYASCDKPRGLRLYQQLKADGFSVWQDKEELLPGQASDLELKRIIKNADAVVICLSKNSVGQKGVVQKQIKLALEVADELPEDAVFIIPLKLEECEIPLQLSKWHYEYFDERGYRKLVEQLNRLTAKTTE